MKTQIQSLAILFTLGPICFFFFFFFFFFFYYILFFGGRGVCLFPYKTSTSFFFLFVLVWSPDNLSAPSVILRLWYLCEENSGKLLSYWVLACRMPFSLSCHGTNRRQFGWIDFIRNWAIMYFSIFTSHGDWASVPAPNSYYLCVQLSILSFPPL